MQNDKEDIVKYDAESLLNKRNKLEQTFSEMLFKRLLKKLPQKALTCLFYYGKTLLY